MMFEDRINAATLLLPKLKKYEGKNAIVVGVPRGAMPMTRIIADGLKSDMTAVLVHKIPSPYSQELAIGCIGLSGHIYLLPYVKGHSVSSSYIAEKAREELARLKARKERYGLADPDFKNRVVIIVDDGIATGATVMCAIHEVRSYAPKKIVLATPVASIDAATTLELMVDEFIALYLPANMYSIGQFYKNFPQVTDDEVINLLHGGEHLHG